MADILEKKKKPSAVVKTAAVNEEPDDPTFQGSNDMVYELFILLFIYILAFATRLFSVIRYESIIHEFDPWFNFRVTKYLVKEGFYNFWNWFDDRTWYPLGRYIGGTLYPGLMWTAALVFHGLNWLRITVNIRNVCVMLAPFMASNTSIAVYLLTKEVWHSAAGVIAAMFVAIAPGYISRSVAGSYDNEAVAIFAIVFTFYTWVKSVKTGSLFWAGACSLSYFYMVASWGGYIFIINIIPLHVLVLILAGRYSHRLYVAYTTFFTLGTLLSMTIPFVQFIPVTSPEHMPALGVFGILQLYVGFHYLKSMVPREHLRILLLAFAALILALIGFVIMLSILGYIPFLTGRLLSLLGSTSNIAIVKSVSEHQPSSWTTFFFDLHSLTLFCAVGIYYLYNKMNDATVFMLLYLLLSSYFASIMVRLVLVLTPAACVVGAIAVSETFRTFMVIASRPFFGDSSSKAESDDQEEEEKSSSSKKPKSKRARDSDDEDTPVPSWMGMIVVFGIAIVLAFYVVHCTWVTSNAYSSPSVILQARNYDGSVTIFDDFREAYAWLRHNTAPDSKILSWWDYGYQITGFANRTVIVDNNTRNNTHIATVGLAMASTEELAYPIWRALGVDYVLVVFGGKIGYSSDDINKFLWMVRISGGVYPRIVEEDFFSKGGQYRIDREASKTMKNCMMYKMCYYRFGDGVTEYGQPTGFDRVRHAEIGEKNITFKYMEEAFTSEHWMVRIYRVLKNADNIGGVDFPRLDSSKRSRGAKKGGKKKKSKK